MCTHTWDSHTQMHRHTFRISTCMHADTHQHREPSSQPLRLVQSLFSASSPTSPLLHCPAVHSTYLGVAVGTTGLPCSSKGHFVFLRHLSGCYTPSHTGWFLSVRPQISPSTHCSLHCLGSGIRSWDPQGALLGGLSPPCWASKGEMKQCPRGLDPSSLSHQGK